jgi:hypothetical protein
MSKYIVPEEVTAPRRQWSLIKVLVDTKLGGFALALGKWNDKPVLAMRWNGGNDRNAIGNPQSRGLPTWFILPDRYNESVLSTLPPDMSALARNFITIPA